VRVPVGATLVRHSDPAGEVAETRAKAAGVLTALGALPRVPAPATRDDGLDSEHIETLLAARNDHLAAFWRSPQDARPLRGRDVLVLDAGDDFTTMLAHQLRHLGLTARVVPWHDAPLEASEDLVVFGPGPGDPRDHTDPRIARFRELIAARLASGRPLLAVCLSHQVLAELAGLPIESLPAPRQGVQLEVEVFGDHAAIGFYNTFSAVAPNGSRTPRLGLEVASDAATGVVQAMRGAGVASVQGHLESVTSPDGFATLERLIDGLFATPRARGDVVTV
jgi:2-amino-4-deoxychorismate synthase